MPRLSRSESRLDTDVLVVGGGIAGMSLALRLAEAGRRCLLLTKSRLTESSSLYAQGGIAAVLSADDTLDSHVDDTLAAGAGLCHRDVVEMVVNRGPAVIRWLIDRGVTFSMYHDDAGVDVLHLTREGGHSHRRVIHAEDATGRSVTTTLGGLVRGNDRIRILEDHIGIDLITSARLGLGGPNRCLGLHAYNIRRHRPVTIGARAVVLATGGASKVYMYTSNPDTSTGDGIAMAWRAGCRVANLEFVQFHPTCLYHPHAKSFLISEAVRGEGGLLVLDDGYRFMPEHDPRAELAARDIVARAIDYEMKRRGLDCVYLDISHQPPEFILRHFPNIHRQCLEYGFDITRQPIPVVPAAHYTCGGIVTDLRGRTDIDALHAIGECSMTGLHGANRLASNSLLECLVFAESASECIVDAGDASPVPESPTWDESRVTDPDEQIVVSHNWDELRHFMWDYVGIVRTNKRLQRAANRLRLLDEEIREFYSNFKVSNDLIELRNLVLVADLIVRCAQRRHESRGLHYNLDFPRPDPTAAPVDTVLSPGS